MGGGEIKQRMNLFAEEAARKKRFTQLRRETLKKAEFLKKKAVIEPGDVYHLIKEFFKNFLEQDVEFTIDELRSQLRTVYISNATRTLINEMLREMHKIEYTDVAFDHKALVQLIEQFSEAVQQLVRTHTKPKSLFAKVRSFLFKEQIEPDVIIAELPVVEDNDAYYVRIHTLIEKCYVALDKHKFHRAKAGYQALLNNYATLPNVEKKKYYPLIDQTYQDIINRTK